jgi:hypothetical protein
MDKTYKILNTILKTCFFVVIIGAALKIFHVTGAETVLKTGIYAAALILIYQNNKLKAFVKSIQQSDER